VPTLRGSYGEARLRGREASVEAMDAHSFLEPCGYTLSVRSLLSTLNAQSNGAGVRHLPSHILAKFVTDATIFVRGIRSPLGSVL
jgi:hypothetical protein